MSNRARLALLFALLAAGAAAAAAQPPEAKEEFVAVVARFRIGLPRQHEFALRGLEAAGQKLFLSTYNWKLGPDQAVVGYADAASDMEGSPQSAAFLSAIRDAYAGEFAPGVPVAEKPVSLDGHHGLLSVVQSDGGRTMVWVYLVKNRIYVASLSLRDAARTQENVRKVSSLRLLTRDELAARYEQMIAELTPTPLPQEPTVARPTSDAQDARLKGKVRRVFTEQEQYFGGKLLGVRRLVSDDLYDEQGNLTKSVLYHGELPHAVRVYGHVKGERVYSEWKRSRELFPPPPDAAAKAKPAKPWVKPPPKIFRLRHKHDADGRLIELRVLAEDGG
jgi:hypothetical protein